MVGLMEVLGKVKDRVERFLNEKNVVTDLLGRLEENTGIKKKIIAFAWNGSQVIYNRVVRPIFLRHEATVDAMVNDLSGKAMSAAESVTREGAQTHQLTTSTRPVSS
ncbi:hypothetical protein CRUP_030710 [Coryphaenoides rupestris]|nr:hypothetical protein CRUP_030710 [Coryphaenoides rupestris]